MLILSGSEIVETLILFQYQCTIDFSESKTFGKTGRYSGKSGMSNHLSGANAQFIIVSETLLCGGRQNDEVSNCSL